MGHRTLKRVPLDFAHPQGETWPGYLNAHYRKCPDCERGYTLGYEALETIIRRLMLAGADARGPRPGIHPHPYLREMGIDRLSPDLAVLTTGLAGREPFGPFGHDSMDTWAAAKKVIEAAGLDPKTWGICPTCGGNAVDPAAQEAYDAWRPTEPPTGEGWQLWETTSEGSPVSPVFATAEALADWCAENASTFASVRASREEWLSMFREGADAVEVGSLFVVEVPATS